LAGQRRNAAAGDRLWLLVVRDAGVARGAQLGPGLGEPMKIQLMLQCNHAEDGSHLGHVYTVQVPGIIEVEGLPLACEQDGRQLTVGTTTFPLIEYQAWVGNWCWDCAMVHSHDLAQLLMGLRGQGWQVNEAESGLFEAYEAGETLWVQDLERLWAEQEVGR